MSRSVTAFAGVITRRLKIAQGSAAMETQNWERPVQMRLIGKRRRRELTRVSDFYVPFCNSSHFFPTLPTHVDTGGTEPPTTDNDANPGIDDGGGKAESCLLTCFLCAAASVSIYGEAGDSLLGETITSMAVELDVGLDDRSPAYCEQSRDFRRCTLVDRCMSIEVRAPEVREW
ncbi:hypothetical protein SERLA73DRAFT_175048, partial [Serpula lacrymans var. lacrymans S7.3]